MRRGLPSSSRSASDLRRHSQDVDLDAAHQFLHDAPQQQPLYARPATGPNDEEVRPRSVDQCRDRQRRGALDETDTVADVVKIKFLEELVDRAALVLEMGLVRGDDV